MDDWSYDLDRVETPPSSPRAKGIHTVVIKDSGNHVMNTLYDVKVLEKLVEFICMYSLNPVVPSRKEKIESLRRCIALMTKYNQIPEVWVSKVHVILRDIKISKEIVNIAVEFGDCGILSKSLKDACYNGREHLIDEELKFETARDEWMYDHPSELHFIFMKMGCFYGFEIEKWDLSDCLQFEELENVEGKSKN
jgi:hypothetical protein